ncbi:hypothetical protein [Paludisphaera soli]|uniref:hypothetical protein n=1 Tax=Paludisphaera soli TaxID=2712865 RepID=UPI0013EB8FFA|nr:hypothetical protein [Paludisphaera soli]
MLHGTATVVSDSGSLPLVVTVRVAVERPDRREDSHLRCTCGAPASFAAAALSGARSARGAVDRDRFGVAVLEIAGDLHDPASEEGAVVAAVFAVWRAWGHRWSDSEAEMARGWSLREPQA